MSNLLLFNKKQLYEVEHNSRGRSYKWDKVPQRTKNKLIYDNMHLADGMEFTISGFPILKPYNGPTDFTCIPYNLRNKFDGSGKALHFFLNDYQFRVPVWNSLEYTTYQIKSYDFLFTPDLSLWKDYPTEFYNQQNIFRTRFIGLYWQLCGLNVIPTASWGGLNSFKYCFEGLPTNSIIAVSGMGNQKDLLSYNIWCNGIRRLEEDKKPTLILVYGQEIEIDGIKTPIQFIPDFITTNLRKIKKHGK